jgi:plastocyanin
MDAARITRLVALVVLALAMATFVQTGAQEARAGGGCRGVAVTEVEGDTVTMLESCFEPSVLRVEAGQEVTFLNTSAQPHNVAGQNTSWGSYDELLNGQSVTHAFAEQGTYAYYCMFQPGMVGVVVVGDGKGVLTGSVARVEDGDEESLLASVPQGDQEPDLVAPATDATRSASGETDWLVLAGVAVVGAVAGGGAMAVARRR